MAEFAPVEELFDLTGKVAVVTGATGQLGEAFCETLADLGANVVVVARTAADCDDLAERLTAEYERAISVPADITDPDEVRALAETVEDEFGRADVVVNNAHAGDLVPFEEMDAGEFESGLEVALTGSFLVTRELLPLLRRAGGSVINLGSIYGLVGPDHRIYGNSGLNSPVNYAVAKAGVTQFSRWVATRYAEDGVRSNTLVPGGIYNADLETRDDYESTFVPAYENRTPLGRMGTPEDLQGAVAYLASDASGWMTGQNLVVDGGLTAW